MALTHKNNALDDLQIANINLSTTQQTVQSAGNQGLQYSVYTGVRDYSFLWLTNEMVADQYLCSGVMTSSQLAPGWQTCGRNENIVVVFTGRITAPAGVNQISFAGYTDDGFRMYVDGNLVINNWREQGSAWSGYYYHTFTETDRTFDVRYEWYNGGGPGYFHIGWGHSGYWTGVATSAMSYGQSATQQQIDAYNQALATKNQAQDVYNDKLFIYNQEVTELSSLQSQLTQAQEDKDNAQDQYETAQQNTSSALISKDSAVEIYNQSISDMNDALTAAEEEYISQWDFEEKQRIAAAIATALANQPQPSPEPSIAPTPAPSPEPTKEAPPPPEASPEPTPEAPPTPEPSPEPTPETSPTPEPSPESTVEPKPTPGPEPTVEPQPVHEEKPGIQDEELAALVPEKGTGTTEDLSGVIANLTSKDNKLVKLSPEQVAAVSQTLKALTQEAKSEIAGDLGISAGEVAKIADQMKSNPALAEAFVEFADRAGDAGDTPMPFTLADAVTEVQTEAFLADPLGALFEVDVAELLSNFSELGMDMTDDQREKAQEVIIPVVIVSQIASTIIGMRR